MRKTSDPKHVKAAKQKDHFLSHLIADEKNANKGTARGRKLLAESLGKYGAGRSILLDKNNRIIAGNKTVESARKLKEIKNLKIVDVSGDTIVAVRRIDLDLRKDKKAKELAIVDNRSGELGLEWDSGVLASLDVDLKLLWNDVELNRLLGDLAPDIEAPEPQFGKAAQLQKKWKTKKGQIWEIGRHRLMCGDSGEANDVAALFGKEKAWLIQTDPPYGVGYGSECGPDSAKRFSPLTNDENDGPKLQVFLERVFACALPYLHSGSSWYLWHAQMTQGFFAAAAAAAAAQLQKLRKDAQRIQTKAETARDYRAALQGIRELERLLELALRFSGALVEGTRAGSASDGNSQVTASISRHTARIIMAYFGIGTDVIHVMTESQAESLAQRLREIYGLQGLSGEEALQIGNRGLALLDAGNVDKNPQPGVPASP